MSLVVTGATGHLGHLVVESLLRRGVPAGQVVAAGRDLGKVEDLAERGVRAVHIDYADPAGLAAAFTGATKVLLVSGSEVGRRVAQHTNVIEASKAAGVDLLVYTSTTRADTTAMSAAEEHRVTEAVLRQSGVPFAVLRNCWYMENYTARLPSYVQQGAIYGCAGAGRVSPAVRAEYAEAAATVLTSDGHAGAVYELGGDEAFSMAELATLITSQTGTRVEYRDLPEAEYEEVLINVGLPAPVATMFADADRAVAEDDLFVRSGDLSRLIGRPTTSPASAIAAALVAA